MLQHVVPVTPAGALQRAQPRNCFDTVPISYPVPQATEPAEAMANDLIQPGLPGSWTEGKLGAVTAQRILILPFAEGAPGSIFWLRLYGWLTTVGGIGTAGAPNPMWLPVLLVQLACRVGYLPGPSSPPAQANQQMNQTENLCNLIVPIGGRLGPSGTVVNAGAGFAAYALVELTGVAKFQFEFQSPDDNPVGANAWWGRR